MASRAANGDRGRKIFAPAAAYFASAQKPLHVLAFLLPLILLYEAGTWAYLTDSSRGVVETIRAHSIILGFFQDFGVAGRFLPALALVTVLIVWQVMRRDAWQVSLPVILGMAIESVAWTAPLLVFGALVSGAAAAEAGVAIADMSWQARLTIAVGAGLYEELLFRMIGIAAVHLVVVDLLRRRDATGKWLAVAATAVAFALYHELPPGNGPGGISWAPVFLYLAAGLYLGWLYLWRGLGIVVGVHALYDALVLVILPGFSRTPT